MSRYAFNIHHVHIADGFMNDCDEIIHKCLQLKTLTYPAFCEIWKDLHFGMIYQGRSSGAEIAELSEEVIYIGKRYLVKDTTNFEESVAGLFLIYGLLTLQPYRGFVWLRIVPEDVAIINRIQLVARRERRLDVLYILGEVLTKHTHYHVMERDRGMEPYLRKYLEGYTSIDKYGVRPRGIFYRQNEELDIIKDLSSITKQYVRAKNSLIGGQTSTNLQYIDDNLPNDLNTTLKRVINGIIDEQEEQDDGDSDDDDDSPSDHYETVQSIKDKAMTNTVNSIKHLTRIEDRAPTTSPKKKIDLKEATGKIKTTTPTKPITTSKRKRKTTSKANTNKPVVEAIDINIDEFHKQNADEDGKNIVMKAAEGEPLIEIEFIDQTKQPQVTTANIVELSQSVLTGNTIELPQDVTTASTVKLSPLNKRKRKDGMELLKVEDESKIKITYQPHMKRTKLKSKFKKMGMLSVANFNDQKKEY